MISPTGVWSPAEAQEQNYPKSEKLAKNITSILHRRVYVIDFGCGDGYYLKYLSDNGFKYVIGVDGIKSTDHKFIMESDLSVSRSFPWRGYVLSLEVGEHIPKQYEQVFIENLCRHCSQRMIISWALPGQRGLGHVNCQPNEYIIGEIEKRGFKFNKNVTDFLRADIEQHVSYFKNTLMVFDKN